MPVAAVAAASPQLGLATAKILCLHGHGTSAQILKCQLAVMAKKCKGLELVFADGPLLTGGSQSRLTPP